MIAFPILPGIEINLFLLIFIALGAGVVSGFAGVGGAFIVMPALIILGFPAILAVGTSLTWVMGNSIIGAFRHGKLGNVDIRLGSIMAMATMGGIEIGVRIINRAKDIGLADEVVLSISICMLLSVGVYTLVESSRKKRQLDEPIETKGAAPLDMQKPFLSLKLQSIKIPPVLHFTKSGVSISLWIMLVVGFFIGMVIGIVGVGGGFIMVPALIYLIGLPSFIAVGTDLFQIIFSAAFGSIRHTMSGNVSIFTSVIMLVASSIGVQFGVLVTHYVHGISVRLVLGISIVIAAIGPIFKLLNIILGGTVPWLETGSKLFTFSGMGLAMIMIIALFIIAQRFRQGRYIPTRMKSFVSKADLSER